MPDIFENEDFTKEAIYFYIERINFHHGYEYDVQNTPAYARAENVTRWKIWLWLEKNGYDFWEIDLYDDIRNTLWEYSIGEEAYENSVALKLENDFELTLQMERRMMFHIRNRMRNILGLSPLQECIYEKQKGIEPLFKRKPYIPYKDLKIIEYDRSKIAERFAYFEKQIEIHAPLNWQIILKAAENCKNDIREEFTDNYTINGHYELFHYSVHYCAVFHCAFNDIIERWFSKLLEEEYPDIDPVLIGKLISGFNIYIFEKYTGKNSNLRVTL